MSYADDDDDQYGTRKKARPWLGLTGDEDDEDEEEESDDSSSEDEESEGELPHRPQPRQRPRPKPTAQAGARKAKAKRKPKPKGPVRRTRVTREADDERAASPAREDVHEEEPEAPKLPRSAWYGVHRKDNNATGRWYTEVRYKEVRVRASAAEERVAAVFHDRLKVALRGPELFRRLGEGEHDAPEARLNQELWHYAGERWFQAMFGSGGAASRPDPPKVGCFDEGPDAREVERRLIDFLNAPEHRALDERAEALRLPVPEGEYEVESILARRERTLPDGGTREECLVKWANWAPAFNTWLPRASLEETSSEALDEFLASGGKVRSSAKKKRRRGRPKKREGAGPPAQPSPPPAPVEGEGEAPLWPPGARSLSHLALHELGQASPTPIALQDGGARPFFPLRLAPFYADAFDLYGQRTVCVKVVPGVTTMGEILDKANATIAGGAAAFGRLLTAQGDIVPSVDDICFANCFVAD